jgi:hypothetical protein
MRRANFVGEPTFSVHVAATPSEPTSIYRISSARQLDLSLDPVYARSKPNERGVDCTFHWQMGAFEPKLRSRSAVYDCEDFSTTATIYQDASCELALDVFSGNELAVRIPPIDLVSAVAAVISWVKTIRHQLGQPEQEFAVVPTLVVRAENCKMMQRNGFAGGRPMAPGEYCGGAVLLSDEKSQDLILQQMWEDVVNLASADLNATAVSFYFGN